MYFSFPEEHERSPSPPPRELTPPPPVSDEDESTNITSQGGKQKAKKKKLVEKTFLDEDGFLGKLCRFHTSWENLRIFRILLQIREI